MAAVTPRGQIRELHACWALAMLFASNVFNQGDRMLFGVAAEPIRRELALSDTALALASGLFFVLFSLIGGVFIARLVDRGHRVRILAAGLALWSLATAATGLAHDYPTLALARICVGIGEATAFPVAMSMIPDLFSAQARGRAISVYQASNFVGIVGGTVIAGVLAAVMGWRGMFVVCGAAGLVVAALLVGSVREPERDAVTHGSQPVAAYWPDLVAAFGRVIATPAVVRLALALGFATMMGAVLGAWGPAFLMRLHGVALADVGVMIGPPVGLGGIVGTLASGFVGDALVRRSGQREAMLRLSLTATLLALPFMAGFILAPALPAALACAAVMNLLLSAAIPPLVNYAIGLVAPDDRGSAATLVITLMGLVGGAAGPALVGAISDLGHVRYGAQALRLGLVAMLLSPLIAAAITGSVLRRAGRSSAAALQAKERATPQEW